MAKVYIIIYYDKLRDYIYNKRIYIYIYIYTTTAASEEPVPHCVRKWGKIYIILYYHYNTCATVVRDALLYYAYIGKKLVFFFTPCSMLTAKD